MEAQPPKISELSYQLFQNHLEFLRTHRGSVTQADVGVQIESTRPEFSYLICGRDYSVKDVIAKHKTIHVAPWSALSPGEVECAGFSKKNSLTYMSLSTENASWSVNEKIHISCATDSAGIETFSEIQSRGFLETPAAFEEWHPWLRAANKNNFRNPTQTFYIGSLAQRPASVALTVQSNLVMGIYAVATLPEFRRQGISTAIMKNVARVASSYGCHMLTLQVVRDSSAERFYKNLGFKEEFIVDIFTK